MSTLTDIENYLFRGAGLSVPSTPIDQAYGVQNASEPGGYHHGVDLALPAGALVLAPVGGYVDKAETGLYSFALDVPHAGQLLFGHLNTIRYPVGSYLPAGTPLGTVLGVNPANGASFDTSLGQQSYYDSTTGITQFETTPHIHLETHTTQSGLTYGSDTGLVDPALFFKSLTIGKNTDQPTYKDPVTQITSGIGGAVGGAASGIVGVAVPTLQKGAIIIGLFVALLVIVTIALLSVAHDTVR